MSTRTSQQPDRMRCRQVMNRHDIAARVGVLVMTVALVTSTAPGSVAAREVLQAG